MNLARQSTENAPPSKAIGNKVVIHASKEKVKSTFSITLDRNIGIIT